MLSWKKKSIFCFLLVIMLKRQQIQAENPDLPLLSNSLQLLLGDPKELPDPFCEFWVSCQKPFEDDWNTLADSFFFLTEAAALLSTDKNPISSFYYKKSKQKGESKHLLN